jgi:hypothetical protein
MTADYDIELKEYTITMSEEEASHLYSLIDNIPRDCNIGLSRLITYFTIKKLIGDINIKKAEYEKEAEDAGRN